MMDSSKFSTGSLFFIFTSTGFAMYQIRVRIGSPITGYGQESRNRAARQRIPHRVWTDEDGAEHVEVKLLAFGQFICR